MSSLTVSPCMSDGSTRIGGRYAGEFGQIPLTTPCLESITYRENTGADVDERRFRIRLLGDAYSGLSQPSPIHSVLNSRDMRRCWRYSMRAHLKGMPDNAVSLHILTMSYSATSDMPTRSKEPKCAWSALSTWNATIGS